MFFALRNVVATAVLLALGAVPMAVYAQASYSFNLPAQPLADALRALGSQAGVNVAFDPATVQGRNAPALQGNYAVQQALDQLLEGSGLVLRTTQGGSFLVEMRNTSSSVAHPALAQSKTFDFHIQSQSLAGTLRTIGRTTGQRIDFDIDLVSKKKADAVNGRLTGIEALQQALMSTGMHAEVTPSGVVTIVPGPASTSGNTQWLPEVMVHGTVESLSATRVPTALKEIPQSVSVISQDTLQQQNDNGLAEALTRATGIVVQKSTSLDSIFLSRGFYINEVHIDGGGPINLTNSGGAGLSSPVNDLSEYDHIEVLRGSDALFGGAGNPGATLSLERKQPQAESDASATVTIGSHDYYREVFDATGALGLDGALRGRIVAANTNQDYFYDRASRRQHKFYGVMQYDMTPTTMLTIGGSLEQVNAVPISNGLPLYANGADPHLPRSTSLIFPMNHSSTHNNEVFFKLDQKFNDYWKLKIEATSLSQTGNFDSGGYESSINLLSDSLSGFVSSATTVSKLSNTASATLTGSFDLGGQRQEVVAGVDYTRQSASNISSGGTIIGPLLNPWSFDPTLYNTVAPPSLTNPSFSDAMSTYSKQIGGYAALRLHFWNDWSAVLGARDNYYRGESESKFFGSFGPQDGSYSYSSPKVNQISTGVVAPYAGLTYDINKQYSVYGSYADIYQTNFGVLGASGAALPAIRGINLEVGAKAAWYHGLLNGSFALYKINQRDTPVSDPNSPPYLSGNSSCCYLAGTNTSKGVDTELSGQLTPDWQIGVGYTFNLNQLNSNLEELPGGRRPLSTITPKHLLKVWTNYRLPGAASRWSLGGGLVAQSSSYILGSACTVFDVSGNCQGSYENYNIHQGFYTVVTLRAAYQISTHWSAALNIENLFDRTYYQTLGSPLAGNWYGSPRSFMLKIKAQL
jgi:outer membrane receptor for ferric coprogen and ferric-rhodotorulic acid